MAHQHDDRDLNIEMLDEQIERLSQAAPHLLHRPDARLVKDLRGIHASAARAERKSLEHVLMRLHEEQRSSTGASPSENHRLASQTQGQDDWEDSANTVCTQKVGNYGVVWRLDLGGFAHVYLAEQIYLKTFHAVKVLQMHLFDEEQRQHFLEEARIIAHLHHPHIVQVTDFGVENAIPFLVMSCAANGNLRQCYPEGSRVPLATVVRYVAQVAEALQYAHDRHLVHRDIKPENLLLDASDSVMLSDFGIAIVAHSSHSQSLQNVVGTVLYMPPEQLKGRPRPASDQYALATLVYEWLCGALPFEGETYLDIARQHLHAPVPSLSERLPEIAPAVAAVISQALAKEPHQRFASIQDFADALEQASRSGTMPERASEIERVEPENERGVEARREQFREKRRPSRRLVLAMMGSAGALAAGGSYLGWKAVSGPRPLSHVSPQQKENPLPPPGELGKTVFVYTGLNSGITNTYDKYYIDTLAWSPDSTRILLAGNLSASAFPTPGKLLVWRALTGEDVLTNYSYSGIGDPTYYEAGGFYRTGRGPHAAWSPDGMHIVTMTTGPGSNSVGGPTIDYGVNVLNASTGGVALALPASGSTLAWSSGGRLLELVGSYDGPDNPLPRSKAQDRQIVTLDASTGYLFSDYDAEFIYAPVADPAALSGNFDPHLSSLDIWASSTRFLASFYNQSVNIWDTQSRQLVSRYHGDGSDPMKFALVWSPDEQYIASGWGSEVHISSARTGQHVFTYNGHSQTVKAIAWSPDGSRLASGGDDVTVQVWEVSTGRLLYTYREHTDSVIAVAWSPDGRYLASGGAPTDGTVHIWKAK